MRARVLTTGERRRRRKKKKGGGGGEVTLTDVSRSSKWSFSEVSGMFSRKSDFFINHDGLSRHCFARMLNAIISLAALTFELLHCSLSSLHNGTIMKISAKRVKYLLGIVSHSADISHHSPIRAQQLAR